jgi:hypothetical protein
LSDEKPRVLNPFQIDKKTPDAERIKGVKDMRPTRVEVDEAPKDSSAPASVEPSQPEVEQKSSVQEQPEKVTGESQTESPKAEDESSSASDDDLPTEVTPQPPAPPAPPASPATAEKAKKSR